jgi:hypothetical protein
MLEKSIRDWMRRHVEEHRDRKTDEINCTGLAESCAFDLGHAEWLDDETHEVWDVAVTVAHEAERKGAGAGAGA